MNKSASGKVRDLHLAFDVGHSSIGWAVLQPQLQNGNAPEILGCGVVTFRADDCLASARRGYRRQRRHIRSTRQRISRMKRLLANLNVLTPEQLDQPGCAWPWKLAAGVLAGGRTLSCPELWDVLRWYAHNRGYDGNRRWSAAEEEAQKEDTEKVQNAHALMEKHGTRSMAATFCKELGIDPLNGKSSSTIRFKGLNAAFPRQVVEQEVRDILRAHFGKLPSCDSALEKALLDDWRAIECADIQLPGRFEGGVLFGQLVPRFDNRIISRCPMSGGKVPSRNSREFLEFRWAMQVANIRVADAAGRDLRPLNVQERAELTKRARERGYVTPGELIKVVAEITGCTRSNLEAMLVHPDAKEALLINPVQKVLASADFSPFWRILPERLQKRFRGKLRNRKSISLHEMRDQLEQLGESTAAFDRELQLQLDRKNTKGRQKQAQLSREALLAKSFGAQSLTGRAPYSREIMKQAVADVMEHGIHPKEEGGSLFRSEDIRKAELNREIAEQTNNHLVRHRLLILQRLLRDIIADYAEGDKARVARAVIEVNRELREFSGKTNKEKAQDLGLRLANFKGVVKKLEANESFMRALNNRGWRRIPPGLIRKARIAEDLGWKCPYTGQSYEPIDLLTRRVDKDHIVPRAQRTSDSLDSLVITFSEINKWKGKRTASKFIEDEQGKPVPGMENLSIVSTGRYKSFAEGLEAFKGHDEDKRRKRKRKELLQLREYEEKEFLPRDLTQTSQLVRLGAQAIKREFSDQQHPPVVISLPGSVTGTLRKGWNRNLLGCLSTACPQVLDESGELRTKTEIRNITHLHHALDAVVLALADYYIPNDGAVWKLILKRNLEEIEKMQLRALGIFDFSPDGFGLKHLPQQVEQQLRSRLAEKRVVQHIPADLSGLDSKETVWRVFDPADDHPNARRIARWLREKRVSAPGSAAATVLITCRKRRGSSDENATGGKVLHETKTWRWVFDIKDRSSLVGLAPEGDPNSAKLKSLKAVKVLEDNFGLALDPEPTLIRPHKIWHQLQDLKRQNSGAMPRVLRIGNLIEVPEKAARSDYRGVWMVRGVTLNQRAGFLVDLSPTDRIAYRGQPECFANVSVAT